MDISKADSITLETLVLKSQQKNWTRKLSLIHEQVEEAIAAGASYAEVIHALKEQGFGDIPMETFRSVLYRIRKRAKRSAQDTKVKVTAPRSIEASPMPLQAPNIESNPQENTAPSEPLTGKSLAKMTLIDLKKRPEPKF